MPFAEDCVPLRLGDILQPAPQTIIGAGSERAVIAPVHEDRRLRVYW